VSTTTVPVSDALRVLIVEDEGIVAMWLADALADLGCIVVGPAARVTKALALIDSERVEAAILDINVAGETVFPVADKLLERGIPFVFATGYGIAGLTDAHRDRTVLQKPYLLDTLQRTLEELRRQARG
jgi:CheY-like chemotaxis protein